MRDAFVPSDGAWQIWCKKVEMVDKLAANKITSEVTVASVYKPPIFKWLGIEFALLALLAGFAYLMQGTLPGPWALSCLLGGMLAIVPHAYFALLTWRYSGARAAPLVVHAFYRGATGKFVMTLVGFGLIFGSPLPVQPLGIFGSFCLLLAVQVWLAARQTRQGQRFS